ncbi:MAG: HNH endonuclease [Rubrivivax sp.]|nr:HNH endonuclease [Rubrivivax sp.]
MPIAAPKPCSVCGMLVRAGGARCDLHVVREGTFADARRGSRHERGYGSAWDRKRKRILARDHGICQIGRRQGLIHPGTEVDHIVPRAQGGTDDDGNLQTACTACHRAKTQAETGGAEKSTGVAGQDRPGPQISARAGFGVGGGKAWAPYREVA